MTIEQEVFKHSDNKKWFGLVMNINSSKLGAAESTDIEVLNIKLEPFEIENLVKKDGFYPAYHMNKKSWITLMLNETLEDNIIYQYINKSFEYTKTNRKKLIKN